MRLINFTVILMKMFRAKKILAACLVSLLAACATSPQIEHAPVSQSPVATQTTPKPKVVPESAVVTSSALPKKSILRRIENKRLPAMNSRVDSEVVAANPRSKKRASSRRIQSPIVKKMLRQARDASEQKEWARAENFIERALRIEPRNGLIWEKLANIKLAQDKPHQAIQFARKAITLSASDNSTAIKGWRIVEESNLRLNRPLKAEAAKQKRISLKGI